MTNRGKSSCLEEQPSKKNYALPNFDEYMFLSGYEVKKVAFVGYGKKATAVYRHNDLDITIQIIFPHDIDTLLEAAIFSRNGVGG